MSKIQDGAAGTAIARPTDAHKWQGGRRRLVTYNKIDQNTCSTSSEEGHTLPIESPSHAGVVPGEAGGAVSNLAGVSDHRRRESPGSPILASASEPKGNCQHTPFVSGGPHVDKQLHAN